MSVMSHILENRLFFHLLRHNQFDYTAYQTIICTQIRHSRICILVCAPLRRHGNYGVNAGGVASESVDFHD